MRRFARLVFADRELAYRLDDRLWAIFSLVVLPLLAALVLIGGARDIGPAWRAAHGDGPRGTFVVEKRSCSLSRVGTERCTALEGSYRSLGNTEEEQVLLDTIPEGARSGSQYEVIRGPGNVVYLAEASNTWLIITGLMVAAMIYLGFWTILIRRKVLSLQRNRSRRHR